MDVTVRRNDTLWYYSQLFNVPLILVQRSNPNVIANQLNVDDRIKMPGYRLLEYVVKENDTLWQIANRYSSSVDALTLVNPNINPLTLQIGQIIFIPSRVNDFVISDANDYTYEKLNKDIEILQEIYPFIFKQSIGKSVMGKDLMELQIGSGTKTIHINGSFHANEWITTAVIMRLLNEYALSLTNNKPIRELATLPLYMNVILSVVPMVNPDGVDLVINGLPAAGQFAEEVLSINNQRRSFSNWKANIRGVDLNNQFPAMWEIEAGRKPKTPQPRDYPGPRPLSEPEAIAMVDLANKRNFLRMNAFHTQGEVIFWGFEGLEPPVSEVIVSEYARVSGYTPIRYVDSYAGYKDWFIQQFRNPGFTIELGKGTNPLPISQLQEIYEKTLGIFLVSLLL